jgi:proteasome accessory factor B
MSAARTERLLNLLTLLVNSRRPVALRDIRELDEFGAYRTKDPKSGERAFERDKAALQQLGVPLRWVAAEQDEDAEGEGGYLIDRQQYFLPELELSAGEVALLTMAGAAAAGLSGFSGKAAIVRALAKLGFDCEDTAARLPALAHLPAPYGVDAAQLARHLEACQDALANRQGIHLHYVTGASPWPSWLEAAPVPAAPTVPAASLPQQPSQRLVSAYGLYYRRGTWYLVGFCHMRQALRTFNLHRIRAVRPSGALGAYRVPETFDIKQQARRRPWEYPGAPPQRVSIRLAARLRPALVEIFGDNASVEPAAEGGAWVHLQVTQPTALLACVLPYGDAAEVVAPADLRARLAALYADLEDRYRPFDIPDLDVSAEDPAAAC